MAVRLPKITEIANYHATVDWTTEPWTRFIADAAVQGLSTILGQNRWSPKKLFAQKQENKNENK